jgi:cytochrome c peroxidase
MSVAHLIASDEDYHTAYEAIFGDLPDVSDEERFPEDARPFSDDDDHPEHEAWMDMEPADRKAVTRVFANVGKAIAAYERAIVRVDAPFDEFAQGLREQDEAKMNAIDSSAKAGLKLFLGEAQCDLCHNGAMLSNFEFHNLGMTTRDWMPGGDEGRFVGAEQLESDVFNSMGEFSDAPDAFYPELAYLRRGEFRQKGAFKTSTLRNVEVTAPYMHGGHFETLSEVINFYADLQEDPEVGRRDALTQPFSIDSEQTSQLEAFLKTLTGEELPEELKRAPSTPVFEE